MNLSQTRRFRAAISVRPIGVIHTPFRQATGTPIQPRMARGARGTVVVFGQFQRGLKDLEGFERVWLLYLFHRARKPRLLVTPFLDNQKRGVFSTRAPTRPNAIGMSAVRLVRIDGNSLTVADVDMLDGTPLLDIKPYVPQFDCYKVKRTGWVGSTAVRRRLADNRFQKAVR